MKPSFLAILIASSVLLPQKAKSQKPDSLTPKQQSLVVASALAGKGDLQPLHTAFDEALNTGWTINELKEAMVHLYAYAGFPRSLNGLITLKAVVDERKAKGLNDKAGREPSPLLWPTTKHVAGTALQTKLLGTNMRTSIADFAPVIDTFLKEHLFADIFSRNNLDFQTRELITISTLAGLGAADAQLRSHIGVSMYNGITQAQLTHWASLMQAKVGVKEGKVAKELVQSTLAQRQGATVLNQTTKLQESGMMVRIAEIEIYPDSLNAYKAILKEEAAASVRLEPGVISILPMYQQKDSTQIRILEIYANKAAYELHLKTPHFQTYKTTTSKMVKSLRLVDMEAIDPETMTRIFRKLDD